MIPRYVMFNKFGLWIRRFRLSAALFAQGVNSTIFILVSISFSG